MKGHGEKISRKKQQLIAELIQRQTVKKAAQAMGIGESTAFRWLKDPNFQRCYRKARQQIVEVSISHLQQVSGEAVEVLREILHDSTAPASSRVSAARIILEQAIRGIEFTDILGRIDALEHAILYR